MIRSLALILLVSTSVSFAATISDKIYVLSDSMHAVSNVAFPYITFNNQNNFTQNNPIIELNVGDSLDLWVVNFDSITHEFQIEDYGTTYFSIPAGDSVLVGYKFNTAGGYIYHDPLNAPVNQYLGLGGMIVVKNHSHDSFYWNIKEHDSTWNSTLANNGSVDWLTYDPDFFTINGNSSPDINGDSDARIIGNVGDTLILYMTNTGRSIHSIHLHGYHGTILFASKTSNDVGREKDTFPIYPMQSLVLRIVPDKEGEYPAHDHNLVAVTGNNMYPNGMFMTILISP
jgi:FtsP/CotA-like multicopper oxidase with cupredoxin domain